MIHRLTTRTVLERGLGLTALALGSVAIPTLGPAVLDAMPSHAAAPLAPVDFQPAANCQVCHDNSPGATAMRDNTGAGISPFDLWRSSMMANASRDPYWRAAVSAEMAATPDRKSEIAAKCMRCHAPMASPDGHGDTEYEMDLAILDEPSLRGGLARDGVSCTVCHQISPDRFGTDESYTGNFEINDTNTIFGPHSGLIGSLMTGFTGYNVATGPHVLESALCGTCHTLFTETLRNDGTATGDVFFEQTPYLEWRNSDFQDEQPVPGPSAASCQECHMPRLNPDGTPISTRVVRSPGGGDLSFAPARSPYGKHIFVGGNTLIPQMFRDNGPAIGVEAPAAAFDATIAATRAQLQNDTADLSIVSASRTGSSVTVEVEVQNKCGHKFPTGYPARRAWLEFIVRDQSGQVVFVSGASDDQGQILDGTTGLPLASELAGGPTLPHRDVVSSASEVQTYGMLFDGPNGQVAWRLLQARSYRRDNRLLPRGWSPTHPDGPRTQPYGVAGDSDFVPGSDRVTYQVDIGPVVGPVDVEINLRYQSIMPRHIAELSLYSTPEITAFLGYYAAADKTPEVIDSVTTQL
jgi:hypothetical protein